MGFDLLEFIGKNAAARRSRGRFLLFTNPDDIFSPQIIRSIAMRNLKENIMYATQRESVGSHIPVGRNASTDSMLRFVESNKVFMHWWNPAGFDFPRASCLDGEEVRSLMLVHTLLLHRLLDFDRFN